MEFQKIKYTVSDSIAYIALDSPHNFNALDEIMINEIVYALNSCEKDTNVKVIIIGSTGKAFSSGGDIGAMYKGIKNNNLDFEGVIKKVAQISLTIKKLSKPVIASVRGAVAGAAFNIVLSCDFCIAAEDTKFIQAFVNIGLVPDAGGLYLLTRSVGVNKAVELVLTGTPVNADDAKQLGFVKDVVPIDSLDEATSKLAKKLSVGPSASYAQIKRLIFESQFRDFESYIEEEVKSQTICCNTEDFKEGICAFVEKRKPNYK